MKVTIAVDNDKCTRCLHCVKVCPAEILLYNKEAKKIELQNLDRCIGCGHCASACDYAALQHSEFTPDKIHDLDYNLYPSAEQMREIIRGRRSNRAFSTKPIPEDKLMAIVDAAYHAPTSTNQQKLEFVLITDPAKMKLISDFTMNAFGNMLKKMDNFVVRSVIKRIDPKLLRYIPLFKEMQQEYAKGRDGILRGATAVLLIYTPKKVMSGDIDSNLAYQNASLMAESCGVTQFYTGFVLKAISYNKGKLERMLNIDGEIHAGMAMALPLFRMNKYVDRKPMKLTRM